MILEVRVDPGLLLQFFKTGTAVIPPGGELSVIVDGIPQDLDFEGIGWDEKTRTIVVTFDGKKHDSGNYTYARVVTYQNVSHGAQSAEYRHRSAAKLSELRERVRILLRQVDRLNDALTTAERRGVPLAERTMLRLNSEVSGTLKVLRRLTE